MNRLRPSAEAVHPVLSLKKLRKVFRQGHKELVVLKEIDFKAYPGDEIVILGASGSGKSTLLQVAGLLEKPSSGHVFIHEHNGWRLSDDRRSRLRQHYLGFIYQFHHLLPEFSALENIMMPLLIQGEHFSRAQEKALKVLKKLKLEKRATHRPAELSGGEQQRIAILRALVIQPNILFADEPTGNLDAVTADAVFKEFIDLVRDYSTALMMVTHDQNLAQKLKIRMTMQDGCLKKVED